MPFLEIDRQHCAKDGLCHLECPLSLIDVDAAGYPVAGPRLEGSCIRCGHCVAVCPRGCLGLDGLDRSQLAPASRTRLEAEDLHDWMVSRRSVRNFSSRPVPREVVAACLETARHAPSALNSQPAQWTVIQDPKVIASLADLCADFLRQAKAMPDFTIPYDQGRDTILRQAPCLVLVHAPAQAAIPPATDCVIAMTHLELAAWARGLGACWAGILRHVASVHPVVQDFLHLPEGHMVYGALMLGYPRFPLSVLPPRKPVSVSWR